MAHLLIDSNWIQLIVTVVPPPQIVLDLYFSLSDYAIHCVDEFDIQYRKFVLVTNSIWKRLQLDHVGTAKQLVLHWKFQFN